MLTPFFGQIGGVTHMDQGNGKGLARYLSSVDVWAMAFGCMVGWGAFVMPGTTFLPIAGPAGTFIALVIGLLIMLVIGYTLSFLMKRSPRTGGIYSFTKEAFGRDHAFLCSWFLCLSYLTIVFLNGTALFTIIRTLQEDAAEGTPLYNVAGNDIYLREIALSVGALVVVGLLFIAAKPVLQRLHTVLSVILLAGVVVTAVVCLPNLPLKEMFGSFGYQDVSRGHAVFSLIILAPWAFVGFEIVSFETAHFRFPVKRTKWVMLIAILLAGFVYIAMTFVSITAVPDGYAGWADYIADLGNLSGFTSVPTFHAAQSVLGRPGLIVLGITALAAILTGIIGAYRATMRVLSTMAEDKILSDRFSKTSYSILFIMILSVVIALLGRNTLIWFVDLTSFGAIVAYAYTSAAAFKIARIEKNRRVMAAGLAGTVISAAFALVQLVPRLAAIEAMGSEAFLLLSLWCLLGFVFYWRTVKRSPLTEHSGMSVSGTVLFALLVYAALMWIGKLLASREDLETVRSTLLLDGAILILIVFVGLMVMLYIQNLVRVRHEAVEREKIRAVEGNLAKSQFLFNMSHDIRTPMNAILGYTRLARNEDVSDTVSGYLTKIETSGERLLDLINDVLEMSRIENGKLELAFGLADLGEIFRDMHDLFAGQMRQKGLDFSVHSDQVKDRFVWCDRKNLNRVLLNLLSNAYKFTPEGGSVSASIWETGTSDDGYASYEIRVRDTGIGMSPEFAEKMFNAFERERSSTESGLEGTGLGLAITKSIIDLMDGSIDVLTSPGGGTEVIVRFKFRLASEEDLEREAKDSEKEPDEAESLAGRRVLLVEDNAINAELARMILEQMGMEVDTAENGKIAVERIEQSGACAYDVVLMDIQMPVMDGYTATRQIRALSDPALASVPILAMTANAFQEDVKAAEDAGMQAHIPKPIDVDTLEKTLKTVLRRDDR